MTDKTTVTSPPAGELPNVLEYSLAFAFTLLVGALIILDGGIPSAFATLFFVPIILMAYRKPLHSALAVAAIASFFSSPAMSMAGVEIDDSVMPVLWLGWPAVYLFLAVSLNEMASIKEQRRHLNATEKRLTETQARTETRETELEALSSIHLAILSGNDQATVVQEITRQVASVTGAKICTIVGPTGGMGETPMLQQGFSDSLFRRLFPEGAPYGEGVAGWAMLHRRVASSRNVFHDPRYDRLCEFADRAGYISAAAAPVELDQDLMGSLVICYPEERDFSSEELVRLERLARQAELAIKSVRQRETLSRFAFDTALALTEAIESRDPYTGDHCKRLEEYAGLIAGKMALPRPKIELVRLGAALHDMGKIVVPDAILKKPGKLTPEEYAIVKQHCYSGGQICKRVGFLLDAYPIVYHHHERWDGKGYPDGLRGEQIPVGARIVAVADAFDAMTSDRPYRNAMSIKEAIDVLRDGAGQQWDPETVKLFIEIIQDGRQIGGGAKMLGIYGHSVPADRFIRSV